MKELKIKNITRPAQPRSKKLRGRSAAAGSSTASASTVDISGLRSSVATLLSYWKVDEAGNLYSERSVYSLGSVTAFEEGTPNGGGSSSGGSSSGIDVAALSEYLTENGYITRTTADGAYISMIEPGTDCLTFTRAGMKNAVHVPYAADAGTLRAVARGYDYTAADMPVGLSHALMSKVLINGAGSHTGSCCVLNLKASDSALSPEPAYQLAFAGNCLLMRQAKTDGTFTPWVKFINESALDDLFTLEEIDGRTCLVSRYPLISKDNITAYQE